MKPMKPMDPLVNGPMTAEAVNAASMAFEKAPIAMPREAYRHG